MIKSIYCTLLLSSLFSLSAYANPYTGTVDSSHLSSCNTTDINIVFVLDVGNAELFLPDCDVFDHSEYLLAITYNRSFTADEFIVSSDELVSRNNSEEVYNRIKSDLDQFNSHYQAVKKGDEYRISYTLKNGLSLEKNGILIASSNNKELAMAYFKVWFGDKPFHQRMKNNLLKNIKVPPKEKSAT